MTTVSSIDQLQQRSEELKAQGYEAVRPAAFVGPNSDGSRTFSWGRVCPFHAHLLGFMEWGLGNRRPNLVYLLSKMSPFTAAGVDFVKKILVGRGPCAKYHYTQYVGGNITEKYIPFPSAGTLFRGQIADLKAKEKQMSESENRNSESENQSSESKNQFSKSVNQFSQSESASEDSKEMKSLKEAYDEWERTNKELQKFIDNNDLHQTYLDMAGDMSLMSQCFCELQLNQRQQWRGQGKGCAEHL